MLAASLSVAMVKNDDQGNTRLAKKGSNNTGSGPIKGIPKAGLAFIVSSEEAMESRISLVFGCAMRSDWAAFAAPELKQLRGMGAR